MKLQRLDHLVLTVRDISTTVDFYTHILGMELITFAEDRKALRFGEQKINLHQQGEEFEPKAKQALPGSADICLLTSTPINEVIFHLQQNNTEIIEGPVERTGARHALISVYIRDPDGNLLEIANEI
ncbi:MAG: VOC family protein [Gammaproteobacteria bacterium]|jgi:catechol 2,3-dioxygenase-like lactoylglutathione lyase family enzyme